MLARMNRCQKVVCVVFLQCPSNSKAIKPNPASFKYLHRSTTIAKNQIALFHFNHQSNQTWTSENKPCTSKNVTACVSKLVRFLRGVDRDHGRGYTQFL